MNLEVILNKEVQESVKQMYIQLKLGKKAVFDRVNIDTDPISSSGVFHIKLRHLDSFIEYDLSKTGQKEKASHIETFALLYNLDVGQAKEYYSIWEKVKNQMQDIGGRYGIMSRLKLFCGKANPDKRNKELDNLLRLRNEGLYKTQISEFAHNYNSFLKFESDNPLITNTLNTTIKDTLVNILNDPFEVYYAKVKNSLEGDFVFCSDKYGIELVLVLKTAKNGMTAEVFTAYSQRYNNINKGAWQQIYSRNQGCLIKNNRKG